MMQKSCCDVLGCAFETRPEAQDTYGEAQPFLKTQDEGTPLAEPAITQQVSLDVDRRPAIFAVWKGEAGSHYVVQDDPPILSIKHKC